jgi:hypothetical protein
MKPKFDYIKPLGLNKQKIAGDFELIYSIPWFGQRKPFFGGWIEKTDTLALKKTFSVLPR